MTARLGTATSRAAPLHVAFLGCGFISEVHSRHLAKTRTPWRVSYASRSGDRAEEFRRRLGGERSYAGYEAAIADPDVDVVVVAVPPRWHRDLALDALAAGKHVLVEKPAFPSAGDYEQVVQARDRSGTVVMVGENDHYKPLVGTLRRLLADGAVGELVMAQFTTVADKPKPADDWRNDETLAGGDAFFEEGVHWLHVAGNLGPRIVRVTGHRPRPTSTPGGADRRGRSQLISFDYDTGAVGALFYSREVPSLLHGVRVSKLYGRRGVITFESNGGVVVLSRAGRPPRLVRTGWRDIRGYRAMYDDLATSIRAGRQPSMSLERALEDHHLMEQIARG